MICLVTSGLDEGIGKETNSWIRDDALSLYLHDFLDEFDAAYLGSRW